MALSSTELQRLNSVPIIEDFHLVWLDSNIDQTNDDYRSSIAKLQEVINTVNTFVDANECIDFINDRKEEAFVIISDEFEQSIISIFQGIPRVSSIYLFSSENPSYKKCGKVSGIYTNITCICEALRRAIQENDRNIISISIAEKTGATDGQSRDTLGPSFMYIQILKEILLTIDFETAHFDEFIKYGREQCAGTDFGLKKIDKIEKEYHHHQPIWWYTYETLLYSMLNRALRTMETDSIVKMGFFVRDLHQHIAQLHSEQYSGHHRSNSFTVYRGQRLSRANFEKLQKTQGGLLAFNNFLSTSRDRNVARALAESSTTNPDFKSVLFIMNIDPSISSTPFANIKDISHFQDDDEILFSIGSVFRIGQMKQNEQSNDCLWQVELTLTSDYDPQLEELTKSMREKRNGSTGWFRLGRLMMEVAQFDKAQQLFEMILDRTTDEKQKGDMYYYLGCINKDQGRYAEALTNYEKLLTIRQRILPDNHPDLATSYDNIGVVYYKMGEYSKALSSHEKALAIQRKTFPVNHPSLTSSYNNIGEVYKNMGEYSKALSYYEKALGIFEKTLPDNHPDLATSYNNIGAVYDKMGEYSKALSSHEKALEIQQKTLSANHPDLNASRNNIRLVCEKIGPDMLEAKHSIHRAYQTAQNIHEKYLAAAQDISTVVETALSGIQRFVALGRIKTVSTALQTCLLRLQKPGIHSTIKMETGGFFYTGKGDTARCNHCDLQISGWTIDMNPFTIHAERSPKCPYVQKMRPEKNSIIETMKNLCKNLWTTNGGEQLAKRQKMEEIPETTSSNTLVEVNLLKHMRRRTFSHWPHRTSPSSAQMIEAGYFNCNVGDRVICLYCNQICQQWTPNSDDPWEVHRTLSPNCPFVIATLKQQQTASIRIVNEQSTRDGAIATTNNDPFRLNEIVYTAACHPTYSEIPRRHASFAAWPSENAPSVDDLIRAGFFYTGTKTIVTCFYCNGSLQNWGANDNPMIEHARWFPHCAYAKQLCGAELYRKIQESKRAQQERARLNEPNRQNGTGDNGLGRGQLNIPDESTLSRLVAARLDLPISQNMLDRNFKLSIIKRCWEDQLRLKLDDFMNFCDLFLACTILQKQIERIDGKKENIVVPSVKMNEIRQAIETQMRANEQVASTSSMTNSSTTTDAEMSTSSDSVVVEGYPEAPSARTEVKNKVPTKAPADDSSSSNLCVLCLEEEKRLACIPCGHLATCVPCGHSLRSCPICRTGIDAFVRIYL